MERGAKLYGALSQAQMVEADEHVYQVEQLGEQELDHAEYFEYVQWEGEAEEEIPQEAPTGHVMMRREQPQGEEYAEEDFHEYVEFNDEEDAKRYIAKLHAGDLIGGDDELVEEGPSDEHLMHEELHDPNSTLFRMYAAPTTRRQATIVECEICGVVLKHPSKIQAHMRTHTGERPFECEVCHRTFTQRTPWRMHMKRHSQDLPHMCSFGCGKSFPNASQRNAHDLRHSGRTRMGPPRPHLKPKKTRIVQRDEMEEIHEMMMDDMRGPPIIDAPLFDEPVPLTAAAHKRLDEVISAVAENRPMRQVPPKAPEVDSSASSSHRPRHKRAPPIVAQCQICGLMLKHPSKIQAHMRSHTGVKPFECAVCGLTVATMYALKMHHRRKHIDGERPLSCTWECGRRFVSVSARNEHERIVHAGIKRYECSIGGCRRLFTRRTHLVQHRLKDHPEIIHVDEFDDAVDLDYLLPILDEEEEGGGEGGGVGTHQGETEVVEEAVDGHVMEEGEGGEEGRIMEEEEAIMGSNIYDMRASLQPPQRRMKEMGEEDEETPPPSRDPLPPSTSSSRPPTLQFQRAPSQLPPTQPVIPRIMKIARIVRRSNPGL